MDGQKYSVDENEIASPSSIPVLSVMVGARALQWPRCLSMFSYVQTVLRVNDRLLFCCALLLHFHTWMWVYWTPQSLPEDERPCKDLPCSLSSSMEIQMVVPL